VAYPKILNLLTVLECFGFSDEVLEWNPLTISTVLTCNSYRLGMDPAGRMGTVVGWGRTSEGGTLPAIAHEVQVPILSLQECRQTKYRPSRITANMLCAGKGTQDSCQVSVNTATYMNLKNSFS
jgi:Trypsin.